MGQRHQLFVIAQVGKRYRVLAAVHNQWLYGAVAVEQCLKVLEIFSAEINQPGIRRELRQAQLRWPDDNNGESNDCQEIVFPFITTCLQLGASVSREDNFMHLQVQPLPINTYYEGLPNDDGISVYDITNTSQVCYGFTLMEEPHKHNPSAEPIIDARQYLNYYKDQQSLQVDYSGPIWARLSTFEMIDTTAMESAWPGSRFRSERPKKAVVTAISGSLSKLSPRDKTMSDVISNALHGDPTDLSWLQHAEELSDFPAAVVDKLSREPDLLHLPSGVDMLFRYLKSSSSVDLTPYPHITPDELVRLVQLLAAESQECELFLPDLKALQPQHLQHIVRMGCITSLHLGNTPCITLRKALKIIAGTAVTVFTCPELYARCFNLTQGTKFETPQRAWSKGFPCGDSTSFPLRQIVYITASKESKVSRLKSGGIAWSHKVDSNVKVTAVPVPLEDALVSVGQLTEVAHTVLSTLAPVKSWSFECSNAMIGATKRLAVDDKHHISCIPGMMYATFMKASTSTTQKLSKAQYLKAGEWTLVLCHDRPAEVVDGGYILRYAFATMDEENIGVTTDAKGFFATVTGGNENTEIVRSLLARWEQKMSGTYACTTQEVLEAMTVALGLVE